MRIVQCCSALVLLVAAGSVFCSVAVADPLPGEILKFQQLPLNNGFTPYYPVPLPVGAPYYGHDELSTATRTATDPLHRGRASTWPTILPTSSIRPSCTYAGGVPIFMTHGNPTNPGVKQFLISFESDVAAGRSQQPTLRGAIPAYRC